MTYHEAIYLSYLAQRRRNDLPPHGHRWDVPCDRFKEAANELLRLGFARKRWLFFGPVGITKRGADALTERFVNAQNS